MTITPALRDIQPRRQLFPLCFKVLEMHGALPFVFTLFSIIAHPVFYLLRPLRIFHFRRVIDCPMLDMYEHIPTALVCTSR